MENEDKTDFTDEIAVRVIIDDVIKRLNIFDKPDSYYEHDVHHSKELPDYGYKISEEEYKTLSGEWYKNYPTENDIEGYCRYLLHYYRTNIETIGRDKDFSY